MNKLKILFSVGFVLLSFIIVKFVFNRKPFPTPEAIVEETNFDFCAKRNKTTIKDGDTLVIKKVNKSSRRRRLTLELAGIDAPEIENTIGEKARQHLKDLIKSSGKSKICCVEVPSEKDSSKVISANCWAGRVYLNGQMVKDGYAIVDSPEKKYEDLLINLELKAREKHLGIHNSDS